MRYEQGQMVWAHLDPTEGHEQAGHRPVLIVSENRFNAASGTVIAMPLTSRQPKAPYPFALELRTVSRTPPPLPPPVATGSWVKPAQVRTLSTERLGHVLGWVSITEVQRALDALLWVCGRRVPGKADNDG